MGDARDGGCTPPVSITPDLVEAAKKEGKVILYSSMDLPVGERLGKAFEAQYPGIAVQIERSGSERLFQRVDQEFASNIRAVDVINTSDASHIITWKKNGWLAPFVTEDIAQHFLPQFRDPDGMSATSRIYLSSIAYNTKLVKPEEAPTSWADLLDPKWAGKMVKGHPAYSGTIMTADLPAGSRTRLGVSGKSCRNSASCKCSPRPIRRKSSRSASAR